MHITGQKKHTVVVIILTNYMNEWAGTIWKSGCWLHCSFIAFFKTRRLLIFQSMMRHGLLIFVMSFKIIKWEVLKISFFFFFFYSCAWRVNLFYRFLLLDIFENMPIHAPFTLAELCTTGLSNLGVCGFFFPSPKNYKQSVEIKWSYSFSAFKSFT